MRKLKNKLKQKLVPHFDKALDFSMPMLLGTLVASAILVSCDAKSNEVGNCTFMEQLSPYQQEVAYKAYHAGLPYDLGLTTVAIAWKESKLGLYKVRYNIKNVSDQSVGVLHTVAKWKVKDMTPFEAGRWVQNMIEVDDYSIQVGVQDILYWQQRAKGDWKKGVGMYNGGYKSNLSYANSISSIVNEIKTCKF